MSPRSRFEIVARFRNSVVHQYIDGALIFSHKNKVYTIENLRNPKVKFQFQIPWSAVQQISNIRIADRLLKNSILQVHKTTQNEFLVSNGQGWWHVDREKRVFPIDKFCDTLPMNRGICESSSGMIHVAEYVSNPDRKSIRIFGSKDLKEFEVMWEFKPGEIRHVHALIPDPDLENRIWILTGDLDHESHIMYTDDEFEAIHKFLSEGQKTRATDLIVRGCNLYWGMDSPMETSFIMSISRNQKVLKQLHELPSPAYYMGQNEAGGLYFGTTVEPGPAVKDRYGRIYALRSDDILETVVKCKKDIFPQYGVFYFPKGILPSHFLVYSQRALRPNEGCVTIARDLDLKGI